MPKPNRAWASGRRRCPSSRRCWSRASRCWWPASTPCRARSGDAGCSHAGSAGVCGRTCAMPHWMRTSTSVGADQVIGLVFRAAVAGPQPLIGVNDLRVQQPVEQLRGCPARRSRLSSRPSHRWRGSRQAGGQRPPGWAGIRAAARAGVKVRRHACVSSVRVPVCGRDGPRRSGGQRACRSAAVSSAGPCPFSLAAPRSGPVPGASALVDRCRDPRPAAQGHVNSCKPPACRCRPVPTRIPTIC